MAAGISLFVPVYNSADFLRPNIEKAFRMLESMSRPFEIVIVDDNSPDVQRYRDALSSVKFRPGADVTCVEFRRGPSRRENLSQAMYGAHYDTIGFIDADFSCDVSYVRDALEALERGKADMVIGSRYIKGAYARRRAFRRCASAAYNTCVRWLFNSRIHDHQCGLKIFRKDTVMPLVKQMGYDGEFIRGWFWDAELLIRAQQQGLAVEEMPVKWVYCDRSTFDLFRELRCLKAIAALWLKFRKRGLDR